MACGRFFVSDTILPENLIQVAQDHILYDEKKVIFLPNINDQKEFPYYISGQETYTYEIWKEDKIEIFGKKEAGDDLYDLIFNKFTGHVHDL